ncbi:MAG: hypothetical protein Q9220_005596 [cf. Caloplaca sp. 1 TL-2023]
MPPGCKGGAFIHDPQLCGEKEVLAQVKLQFRDPSGAKMVVTRNTSLTVQKTKRSQKTLDGSLLRDTNGERMVVSSRVAELNKYMPQYLGVSKAILDNVIFCHQDESLWPMNEPAKLKVKFDEIFEALKYTAAIDNIKKLKKDYVSGLTNLRTVEAQCKDNKDKAERDERETTALSNEIESLKSEAKIYGERTEEADRNHQELCKRASTYVGLAKDLEANRNKQGWLEQHIETLAQGLTVRSEADAWLEDELDRFAERVQEKEVDKQRQSNRYDQLRRKIDTVREREQEKHKEAGKHEQQQASHEQEIEARKALIKESARRHNIRGYETDLDDMQIDEYMHRIAGLHKDQTEIAERVRQDAEKEVQKVREMLNELGEQRSRLKQEKTFARQQSSDNDVRLRSCQSDLDAIATDEGAKALFDSNIGTIEKNLKAAKEDFEKSSWDAKLSDVRAQLRTLEEQVEEANQELVQGTKRSKDLAKLDHLTQELNGRNRGLETLMGAHKERLRSIIGKDWNLASLERDFQRILDQRTQSLTKAQSQRDASSRDLEQTDIKIGSLRESLRNAEKEQRECVKVVTAATGTSDPDTYATDLAGLQNDRDTLKADVDNFANVAKFYKKSIRTAESKTKCELCDRGFHGQNEKSDFIVRIEQRIARDTEGELASQLKEVEADLQKLRSVGSNYSAWLRLSKNEVPRLRSEIQKLERLKATQVRTSEERDREVDDRQGHRKEVESLSKPISNIVSFKTDISSLTEQVEELSAAQKLAGISRSVDDIQEKLESLSVQAKAKQKLLEKTTAEKQQAQTTISTTEFNLSNAKHEMNAAANELEKKSKLAKQVEDFQKSIRQHRENVKRLDTELQALEPRVAEQETRLEDVKQRGHQRYREQNDEAAKLADSIHKLRSTEQTIQTYVRNGGSSRLDRCQREIREMRQTIEKTDVELKNTIIEINRVNEELKNHEATQRSINDNLKYRKAKHDLNQIQAEVDRLGAQYSEADLGRLQEQQQYWGTQYQKLYAERTGKLATLKEKDNRLVANLKKWETDYKNAAPEYKEAHIKVETTKAVIEDLDRYARALDKAIIQYHTLKMEEINRIAEEMWKATYQGTDIDTILIRSDSEGASNNKSYNYRLCMVKQDAEMDMRGRCSAGQRVLACIIVRLALAECFGVKCGLIALDEPTTNLDADNIQALAQSLHDIIRARQQQSNFQLIVITHDEEFLRHMKCADFCDTYFRISRTDRQKSKIVRQSITDVV